MFFAETNSISRHTFFRFLFRQPASFAVHHPRDNLARRLGPP